MSDERKKVWGESFVPSHNMALRRALQVLPAEPLQVLEIGCGAGRFIRTIVRQRPGYAAHGCDLEPLAIASGRTYDDGVHYVVGSATDLPYADESFGLVLVFDVLEHLEQPERALREIHRVLKPGGQLHALVPCEGQPWSVHWLMWKIGIAADLKKRHSGHVQRFTRQGFLAAATKLRLRVDNVSYSMHPLGQMRDIASYLAEEPFMRRWRLLHLVWQLPIRFFWVCSFVESKIFAHVPTGAIALHVSATKQ